jgi:hypothetical protein
MHLKNIGRGKEIKDMGSTGSSNTQFLSGQRYENENTNIFIKGISSKDNTVRFIEGFSPSASHDIQEIPQKNLRDYMKRYGFKFTGYYD